MAILLKVGLQGASKERIPPLLCQTRRGTGKVKGSPFREAEIRTLFFGFGETFRGGDGGGVDFQKAIGAGNLQNAVDHAGGSRETKRAARVLEAGETVHDFSKAATVELGKAGKIEHHSSCLIVAKEFIECQLELLAFDAHLQGAAQLEYDDSRLQLFLNDLHVRLPNDGKILKGMTGSSQSQSA
jgi:hypothetical protein